ncbi:MAG: plasmid recombination protein, partial [Clostridia bacterium]|nr:plasmid recombination protein [Clostridia bacterium]
MKNDVITTIAVHNGFKVARQHNLRNRNITDKENHIRREGIHETWIDEEPKKAYEKLFGSALTEYNAKQVRNDRKIDDYYNHIKKSGNKEKPVYEMIVGVYKSQFVNDEDRVALNLNQNEVARNKEILKEFLSEFQKRNKNIYVCGAYYHEDEEGTPHLHLDYIPYGHYEKGLKVRNSMRQAINEMNKDLHLLNREYSDTHKKINPLECWNKRQRELLDSICKSKGLKISYPVKKKKLEHLSKDDYVIQENAKLIDAQCKDYEHNKQLIHNQVETYNKNKKIIEEQKNIKEMSIEKMRSIVKAYDEERALRFSNSKVKTKTKEEENERDF